MIVLKDGTMLYSEDTARDYLVACGFDCPQLQLPELVHLINKKERDELQDALDEALWSLEDAQDRADELDEECERYAKIIERREKQISFLVGKLIEMGQEDILKDEKGFGIELFNDMVYSRINNKASFAD